MKTNWLRFISQNFTYVTYFRGKIAILKPRSAVTKNALICAVMEVLKPYTTYLVRKASKSCFFELDLCSVARPCFFLMWWCTLGWKSFWKSIHIFHALFWIFLLPIYIPHLAWADFKIKVKQITHSTVHFDWWNPLISKM